MKPIYKAPVVDQIKDLKRACEMALDLLDVMPLRSITSEDMKREGLHEGEFALCDWVVRPRFPEVSCCGERETYPITFYNWWGSLIRRPGEEDYRQVGNSLDEHGYFTISRECGLAIWRSIGLSI